MGFLTPLFLLGALAVAIPLLIHLNLRPRREVVDFPSLMFLEQIPLRNTRKRRLRDILLFFLRCAAIVLLTLAFARPLVDGAQASSGGEGSSTVILLDRSYSMMAGDRFEAARDAVLEELAAAGPTDRFALIAFDEIAELVVDFEDDAAQLPAVLGELEPRALTTRYEPALKLARSELVERTDERRLVLIGDLQRSGFHTPEVDVLPPGTEVNVVDVSGATEELQQANVAISSLLLDRVRVGNRETVAIAARLVARGQQAPGNVDVGLYVADRELQSQTIELEADSTATARFAPITLEPGRPTLGSIRTQDDVLPIDSRFQFVLNPSDGLSVVHVTSRSADGRYVRSALALGSSPRFRVRRVSPGSLGASDLEGTDLVVLDDTVQRTDSALTNALLGFVERGGGLVVALSRSLSAGASTPLLAELGLQVRTRKDRTVGAGGRLGDVDSVHPIFEVFAGERSGDLGRARFYRYWETATLEGADVRAVARFDDGVPALYAGERGAGRFVVYTSGLDTFWNDLAVQPVYLPFVHGVARYAASHQPPRTWYDVGRAIRVEVATEEEGERWIAIDPEGRETSLTLSDGRRPDSLEATFEPTQSGFFRLRPTEVDDERSLPVAVNVSVLESDLRSIPADEMRLRLTRDQLQGAGQAEGMEEAVAGPPRDRQRLWWYVLLVAALVLAVEGWLASRRKSQRRRGSLPTTGLSALRENP